jgi:glycosyltransferase involved in cell wall biosynthesis
MNSLFITVDGYQDYLQSLFLPILSKTIDEHHKINVLEFCPSNISLRNSISSAAKKYNIPILFAKYINKPPVLSSFILILYGAYKIKNVIRKKKIDVLIPRSIIAGAMVLLVRIFNSKIIIIYEADGLVADERIEFGGWKPGGLLYKLAVFTENKLVELSERVITRTQRNKDILYKRANGHIGLSKIHVIPNGKDSTIFRPYKDNEIKMIRSKYNLEMYNLLLIYVGSIGAQYKPDLMLDLHEKLLAKEPNAFFLILTPNIEVMKQKVATRKLKNVIIDTVNNDKIPFYLSAADYGIAFREPSFSQSGICPIKLIEYFMCGLPVITNKGVGDLDVIFQKYDKIGYIVEDLSSIDLSSIVDWILTTKGPVHKVYEENCRKLALKEFDLDLIGNKYKSVLFPLINVTGRSIKNV